MQKTIIVIGLLLVIGGIFWPYLSRIPLGRLPGDLIIDRPSLKVYIPVTSMILISLVISLIIWISRRW